MLNSALTSKRSNAVEEQSQIEHHPSGVFSRLLRKQQPYIKIKAKERIVTLTKMRVHLLQQPAALSNAQLKSQQIIISGKERNVHTVLLSYQRITG